MISVAGLANGPMFRKFTFRIVGFFGAVLVAASILLMMVSNSFFTYLLTFSVLYGKSTTVDFPARNAANDEVFFRILGIGSGINVNANSLVLNTYFKEKRRIATGLSWTITGMGPIIMPQIIAVVLPLYGVEGSLMLYVILALVAAMCSLLYQPAQWHSKQTETTTSDTPTQAIEGDNCVKCRLSISDQKVPSSDNSPEKLSSMTAPKDAPMKLGVVHQVSNDQFPENQCICAEKAGMDEVAEDTDRTHTLWQKIVVSFDLNLLRDFTYVNLMMGVTLGDFAELNFSLLTPFVLGEWDFTKREIATILSVLGGVDVAMRFFTPFIAGKIGWENKTFFLIGIMMMAMGRVCK